MKRVLRARVPILGPDQEATVRALATSSDRVVCVVGRAGAGKTTALGAVAEAFARDGFEVIGAAPSGVAAEKLASETGITSTTLHRLVDEAKRQGGLPRGCVLVVDEAGMADTRTLTRATTDYGGGILNAGATATLEKTTVSDNTADIDGGGIYNYFSTLTLTKSTITDNTAGGNGGGILNNGGTVMLVGSTVSGNIPDNCVGC